MFVKEACRLTHSTLASRHSARTPAAAARSKADEVVDERDRQRVLIQITQNLATRIRNSHAFNLPTFYLPHDDDGGLPCNIPNAIEDVCDEIDKVGVPAGRDVLLLTGRC